MKSLIIFYMSEICKQYVDILSFVHKMPAKHRF